MFLARHYSDAFEVVMYEMLLASFARHCVLVDNKSLDSILSLSFILNFDYILMCVMLCLNVYSFICNSDSCHVLINFLISRWMLLEDDNCLKWCSVRKVVKPARAARCL